MNFADEQVQQQDLEFYNSLRSLFQTEFCSRFYYLTFHEIHSELYDQGLSPVFHLLYRQLENEQ